MKRTYNPISDVRNETTDLTKKLFRNVSDAVHNLDDIRARASCVDQLFSRIAYIQRVRLRDCCERLIFCDKSGFGRKAEELLWRKGYYEVISTAKKLKKGKNNNISWLPEEAALIHHLVLSGVGQYHHLLSRLQFDCGIDLKGIIDNPSVFNDEGLRKCKNSSVSVNGRTKNISVTNNGDSNNNKINLDNMSNTDWALNVAHRCLIYLGDLCRYSLDLQPGWDFGLPAHYYTQALILKPDAGMPFNQLGTLVGTHNFSLDAVYFYMRCMCCPYTFEGAEGNLIHILDKSAVWLDNRGLSNENGDTAVLSRLISRLLYLTRFWFCGKASLLPLHKVCDEFLVDLPNCFVNASNDLSSESNVKPQEIEDLEIFMHTRCAIEHPSYLSEDMIFKIVVIVLMCMQHLEKNGCEEFVRVVALQLAVMSQLLLQALQQLEKLLPTPLPPALLPLPVNDSSVGTNGICKRRRRRRRRRRGSSGGSSDMSEGDDVVYVSSTDSDISEEELVFDENNSEDTDCEDEPKINGAEKKSPKIEKADNINSSCSELKSSHIPLKPYSLWNDLDEDNETFKNIHNLMQQDHLLQTIKVSLDWLTCNKEVLQTCCQGSKTLITRITTFLNYLMKVHLPISMMIEKNDTSTSISSEPQQSNCSELNGFNVKNGGINEVSPRVNELLDEIDKFPLPEDFSLRGLPVFSRAHANFDWAKISSRLSPVQESFLRVCKLVKLGIELAEKKETSIQFDKEKKWFYVDGGDVEVLSSSSENSAMLTSNPKTNSPSELPVITIQSNSIENHSKEDAMASKHGKLMQNMGQLWLRAEVKKLESKVKKTATPLPPYLVLDCDALTLHCPLVKQLATSRKFVIVIPSVVVSALDEQKRTSGRVRDTIRWLESQFRHGNRFLRPQRANEHLSLPLIKYPKKKDKEAWLFFQVVECCNFLNNQGGGKDSGLVTLLTGSPTLLSGSNTSGFSPLGIVNSADISIEHIESFHKKWKSSYKSHG